MQYKSINNNTNNKYIKINTTCIKPAVDGTQVCALLCLTLSDPMDCSLPVSSVHGILQARILEWVASRRGLTPRGSLECNPEMPAFPGEAFHFSLSCIGEGNGNPLQYSCLENPIDRGDWQATVHRVAKTQTQLKQLSRHAHTTP